MTNRNSTATRGVVSFADFADRRRTNALDSATTTNAAFSGRSDETERAWHMSILDKLDEVAKLPLNWDSYGAGPPSPQTIAFGYRVLDSIWKSKLEVPRVLPTSAESIVFEWDRPGKALSLEVFAPFEVQFYFRNDAGEIEGETVDDMKPINDLVRTYVEEQNEVRIA